MRGNGTENARLVDNPGALRVYADGPARVEIHGQNARVTFFEYQDSEGEIVMVPVVVMIMPVGVCGAGRVREMMRRALIGGASPWDDVAETAH